MLLALLKDIFLSRRHRAPQDLANERGAPTSVSGMSEAESECRRRVGLTPNFSDAHNHLGVVLQATGRLAEAEAAFRRAIELKADNVIALFNLGIVLDETNRPKDAETAYRNALKLLPEFAEAHDKLGVVLLGTGRYSEAQAAFERALQLKPDLATAEQHLAKARAEISGQAQTEAMRRLAVQQMPNSAAAHINLGAILSETKRFSEAEAAFRRAIDLENDNAVAFYNLGVVLAAAGRPWDAEAAYRKATELRPDFTQAHNNLARALVDTNRSGDAEAPFRRVLELQPDSAEGQNNLGFVLMDAKRLTEAEAAFRQATLLRTNYEAAQKSLDFVRKEIDRLSRTEASLRHATELAPDSAPSHYHLGLSLVALGKADEAIEHFERALAIDRNHAGAHHRLGVALMSRKKIDEAIDCYARALAIRPDFAQAMADLGEACFAKKHLEEALKWNQAALTIEPQLRDANRNVALMLLQNGRGDEAKDYLERASRKPSRYIEYATCPERTVLLLWTRNIGNVPTMELLFPLNINTRLNWVIESAHDDATDDLWSYDLAFNAMGDADVIGDAVGPLSRFAHVCAKPLLNPPDKIARTARHNLPGLLDGIENVHVPAVWRFSGRADWDDAVVDHLPLLIRPVDSHGGRELVLARTAAELAQCRASQSGPVSVCRFVDFRSTDSWFRKYRVIFVDRKPYPCHLAISPNWMVHYASAEMESHPWKLEEETAFLRNPEAFLGSAAMRAIESIGARIDLEYCGIDFSILPDSRVLVFEANATMLVHSEEISGPLEHKNAYVFAIQARFEEMLKRVCRDAGSDGSSRMTNTLQARAR